MIVFVTEDLTHMHLRNVVLAILVIATVALAQPITADSPFQVRYVANLTAGESYIDIANTGSNGASLFGPGFGGPVGNLCVNVYAFTPDEQMVSCCSCLITPNGVKDLGANRDLLAKPIAGALGAPALMVKLLATLAGATGTATSCTNSAALAGSTGFPIAPAGMAAWGTTLHATPIVGAFATTETAFTPATLSTGTGGELASLTNRCTNIIGNMSGFGICASCQAGALGAAKK
jgi:hypothetical protein